MPKHKLLSSVVLLSFLSGCAADPYIMRPLSPKERAALECKDIAMHIENAERFSKEARKEDRFKPQYILIVPAVVSIYRMDRAEKAALSRKDDLETLYAEKKCK